MSFDIKSSSDKIPGGMQNLAFKTRFHSIAVIENIRIIYLNELHANKRTSQMNDDYIDDYYEQTADYPDYFYDDIRTGLHAGAKFQQQ